MKSTLISTSNPKQKKRIKFPVLAKLKTRTSRVVLFTNLTTGTVVCDKTPKCIGYHASNWIEVTDEKSWEILTDTHKVELSN